MKSIGVESIMEVQHVFSLALILHCAFGLGFKMAKTMLEKIDFENYYSQKGKF